MNNIHPRSEKKLLTSESKLASALETATVEARACLLESPRYAAIIAHLSAAIRTLVEIGGNLPKPDTEGGA